MLAMVIAFSLMAVTAAAYGAEEHKHDKTCCEEVVMPRVLVCVCGEMAHVRNVGPTQISSKTCPRLGSGLHVRVLVGSVYWCEACGYVGANRAKSACMDACTGDSRSTDCYDLNPKTLSSIFGLCQAAPSQQSRTKLSGNWLDNSLKIDSCIL